MMGKMNNIADYVLGSASPKQQMAGIENNMGRMNIVPLLAHQDDVNKNNTEKNGSPYSNDNSKVKFDFMFYLHLFPYNVCA